MKLIRMIGLAAISAIATMAFLGTSGASASTLYIALCKEDKLICPTGKLISHLHETDPSAELLTSLTDITCNALFLGDVLTPNLLGHLWLLITGKFTYANCKASSGASCEAVELNGPAEIEVMPTAIEETEVLGEGEVLVDCSTTPHCVYNGENLKGTGYGALLKGPNGEVVTEKAVTNQVSGFFCPQTSELDALYEPLENEPVYISS